MAIWNIDNSHSEVSFKVKHLVISTVTGLFKSFSGKVESSNDDFSDAKIEFTIDVTSIDTRNEQRDGHLKSADFFDVEKYPNMHFKSTKVEKVSGSDYKLTGDLTIKDVTKPITFDVEFGGLQNDFYGNTVAGFELSGKINRQEYGLTWSAVTETGGIVVSDDVKILANVELHKQA